MAGRLLKPAKIRKTKTVAIRVGDDRTIHSHRGGGGDVTVRLGDEQVAECWIQTPLILLLAQTFCAETSK